MKKVTVVMLAMLSFNVKIDAAEMQIFGGFEFGLGVYKVDHDFWYNEGIYYYDCHEDTSSIFWAPGLTLGWRTFQENSPIGTVFRGRALFVTKATQKGKVSINGYYEPVSETYSAADDNFFISSMDFDLGISTRFKTSGRLQFYADLGLNVTVMDSEQYDSGDTLDYVGIGIFSSLALQCNLTQKLFLEFGINAIMNIISNQEGTFSNPYNKYEIKDYEDTGKFDLISISAYLTIGWRFDLEQLRKQMGYQ